MLGGRPGLRAKALGPCPHLPCPLLTVAAAKAAALAEAVAERNAAAAKAAALVMTAQMLRHATPRPGVAGGEGGEA